MQKDLGENNYSGMKNLEAVSMKRKKVKFGRRRS